jgi:carboxypeptidase family protein/TonB-dependent receptor-like protein
MKAADGLFQFAIALALAGLTATPATAQVGSTTGAIIGTVSDNTKAVMPGVTVTVAGPAMMGSRSVVTGPEGGYRIPALNPGVYTVVFELEGFATITRQGIQVTLGFTATINAEMSPAGLAENVTVTGGSPVVDVASTKIATNFGAENLSNLSGTRDYASITAQVPGVAMTRPSVGSAGAITFQRSTRYGVSGQDRGEVEGIVTTEAAAGGQEIGYSDSDSFEEMALNVIGNTAAMSQPGTLTVVIAKSGGNTYRGRLYADYQSAAMEATNIDDRQKALGVAGTVAVKTEDINRVQEFRDFSTDLGGFVIKDRLWWYGAFRRQQLEQGSPTLLDALQRLSLNVYTAKVTSNLTPNNRLTWYYSLGIKRQNPSIINSTTFATLDALQTQRWPNGPWKVEYDGILGHSAVFEIRGGNFFEKGYYDGQGVKTRYQDSGANRVFGTANTQRLDHERPQVNGSITYSKTGWAGTHDFKFGGEVMHETDSGWTESYGNQLLILNNGIPSQVRLYLPTVKDRSAETELAFGGYAQDTWKVNSRVTFNLGVRVDQYRSFVPASVGPTGQQFDRIDAPIWTNTGPRAGVVYALTGDGKTLVKGNYGRYWDYPFKSISSVIDPNPDQSSSLYTWTPVNPVYVDGFPVFDQSQIGRLVSVTGARPDGKPATSVDPNLKNTYQHQATAYVEREVAPNFGVRTGFVWNGRRQGRATFNLNQPFEAFTVPITVSDPGRDGVAGTADDGGSFQAFNLDPGYLSLTPDQSLRNLSDVWNSNYYTWEVTANKRQSGRWSVLASFSETWSRQGTTALTPNALINTIEGKDEFSSWTAKVSGTLDVRGGIRFSPMLRTQQGAPFARTFQARLNYNSAVAFNAEPVGAERLPNITILDLRTAKILRKNRRSLGLFFDIYNILNTNADQLLTTTSGSAFLRPTAITSPRIARVGVKFDF